jgi:hypothetical protein
MVNSIVIDVLNYQNEFENLVKQLLDEELVIVSSDIIIYEYYKQMFNQYGIKYRVYKPILSTYLAGKVQFKHPVITLNNYLTMLELPLIIDPPSRVYLPTATIKSELVTQTCYVGVDSITYGQESSKSITNFIQYAGSYLKGEVSGSFTWVQDWWDGC